MARPRQHRSVDYRSFRVSKGLDIEGQFQVKRTETPADRQHRYQMEVRRFWTREAPADLAAIVILVITTLVSVVLILRPGSSVDDKKWAVSILSYLFVALTGFVFGKAAPARDA